MVFRRVAPLLVIVSAVSLLAPTNALARAGAASTHCRHQTFTWTKGKRLALTSAKGPRVRSHSPGDISLTDNLVTAQLQTTGSPPAKFVNMTGNSVGTGQELTHFRTVTVVPVKGKTKTYKVGAGGNSDYVYSRDLLKDYEQVELPVSGTDGQARKTPKLKKVVVTAVENCYSSDT